MVSDVLIGVQPPLTGLEMTRYGSDLEKKSLFSSLRALKERARGGAVSMSELGQGEDQTGVLVSCQGQITVSLTTTLKLSAISSHLALQLDVYFRKRKPHYLSLCP